MNRDCIDEIVKFRDCVYETAKGNMRPGDIAAMFAFALIGSNYSIPSCCILAFCESFWIGVPMVHKHPSGSHMLCDQCFEDLTKGRDG